MASEEQLQELNIAINSLTPNIYFMSMMLGKIQIPSKYKYDSEKSVGYIDRYYQLEKRLRDGGISAEIDEDLDEAETFWEKRLVFAEEWNSAVERIRRGSSVYAHRVKRYAASLSKMRLSSYIFTLPGGHYVEPVYGLTADTSTNPLLIKAQKEAVEKALDYQHQRIESNKSVSTYEYNDIVQKMFEIKKLISDVGVDCDFDEIEFYVSQIKDWLINNVGYGEYIGSFRMLEYGEEIFDRIENLYFEDLSEAEIKRLAHDFEHLIFRVTAFFGETFEDVQNKFDEYIEE